MGEGGRKEERKARSEGDENMNLGRCGEQFISCRRGRRKKEWRGRETEEKI